MDFQKNWETKGKDVTAVVLSFFMSGRLLKEINHTFVSLVPKSSAATSLTGFRPISCCNLLYKIITKVLANMLQHVIGELISPNQSAFLQGRHITDATLLAHELIRDFNSPIGTKMCLKLNLQKAFDTVNREFVYHLMHCVTPHFPKYAKTECDEGRRCIYARKIPHAYTLSLK